jgi:hypothetical protein
MRPNPPDKASSSTQPGGGPPPPLGLLDRWLRLALGMTLLLLFAFVAVPALQQTSVVAPSAQTIIERGIEAGALYYTGVEQVPEAEAYVRGHMPQPGRK